jgi:hypothetical protein
MRIHLASLLILGACAQQKTAPTDDFTSLAGQDEKSDSFSYRMKIVGSMDYNTTSSSTKYTSTPRYRAFKFAGAPHDQVDVWVKSTDGGDSVAWILDNGFHVLASNDDAADVDTLDSHMTVLLPDNASATHYVVFRDYNSSTAHFKVTLDGAQAYDTSCTTDADCVAVFAGGCCPDGSKAAVNVGSTADYAAATACTQPPQTCPLHVIHETRVAQCDTGSHQCAMIEPTDIRCGGFTTNPHHCPSGFACEVNTIPDIPGTCIVDTQP